MGYAICVARTNVQNEKHIRAIAANTLSVYITPHATKRMRLRCIGIAEVFDVLRHGTIVRPPVMNDDKDNLECRMERYVGGRNLAVVVALDDNDPDLIVVTAMIA